MPGLSNGKLRSERGAAIAGLVIALFFIVLMAGLFTYESCRMQMAQREVVAICDASSLTGTAMLTSSDIANDTPPSYPLLTSAQQNAGTYAVNMIAFGSILGQTTSGATNVFSVSNIGQSITAGAVQYVIGLADPTNNYASVSAGDIKGKSISCFMGYGYQPTVLGMVGINTVVTIAGSSFGGLPQVDAVLAFDYSASMDDQTVVTFVRREWIHDTSNGVSNALGNITATTPGCGIIQYISLPAANTPPTIANYLSWDYSSASGAQGTAVNALPPQNLHATNANGDASSPIHNSMLLDLYLRAHYSFGDANYTLGSGSGFQEFPGAPLFRSQDYGTPPGNCDLAVNFGGNGDGVTDVNGGTSGPLLPNAFIDMTWGAGYGFQPAAPSATSGIPINDPYPSTDSHTYTDLVVNIANPSTAGASGTPTPYPYQQPLNGPNTFSGFSFTFDPLEPDSTISGKIFSFPNISVVVEAARGNLESTAATPQTNPWSNPALTNGQKALLFLPVKIDGAVKPSPITAIAGVGGPKDGYQKAYCRLAMMFSQPIATAMLGADQGFFQKLHELADCCFSLVGFSSRGAFDGGTSPSTSTGYFITQGTNPDANITPGWGRSFYIAYPPFGNTLLGSFPFFLGYATNSVHQAGNFAFQSYMDNGNNQLNTSPPTYSSSGVDQIGGESCNFQPIIGNNSVYGFRLPRTQLAVTSPAATDTDQYLACTSQSPVGNCWSYLGTGANGIYNGRPESETDTSEALITSHLMFHSSTYEMLSTDVNLSRPASRKIVVFFTDGEPTGGLTGPEATATQAAAGPETSSGTCAHDGIAIYTIGLNVSNNPTLNTDQQSFLGATGSGLAALAGNGGQFYPCTSGEDVINAFSAVARHLTQGQR